MITPQDVQTPAHAIRQRQRTLSAIRGIWLGRQRTYCLFRKNNLHTVAQRCVAEIELLRTEVLHPHKRYRHA